MKDIVDRYNSARVYPASKQMLDDSIAEVVRLRARIAELEALLKPFAVREPFQLNLENGENSVMAIAVFGDEQASARAALKGGKG